jgi:hypothetical protein
MNDPAPETMPTELGVKSEDGDDVPLKTLWRDGPVVLAFVRHFG